MAGKTRTWIWVVVAIAVVIVLGVIALAAVGFYLVSRHIDAREIDPAAAAREFEAATASFADRTPLVELDSEGRFLRAHTDRPPATGAEKPDTLHLLAFDPRGADGGRIVRFELPFWLLRIRAGNATIELEGNRLDLEDLKLTVDDLERYGPSVIIDHTTPDGERVLVWSR